MRGGPGCPLYSRVGDGLSRLRQRLLLRVAELRADDGAEDGNALIEFVVLGILTLVPLIYLVVAAFTVERNVFAVTQAAREAGRAYAEAGNDDSGRTAARSAVDLALSDQKVSSSGVRVSYVPVGQSCAAAGSTGAESSTPGSEFAVCVRRTITVPGVPGFLDARQNSATGRFVVHVDDFRDRKAGG